MMLRYVIGIGLIDLVRACAAGSGPAACIECTRVHVNIIIIIIIMLIVYCQSYYARKRTVLCDVVVLRRVDIVRVCTLT